MASDVHRYPCGEHAAHDQLTLTAYVHQSRLGENSHRQAARMSGEPFTRTPVSELLVMMLDHMLR